MKKIYLLGACLFATSFAFNQINQAAYPTVRKLDLKPIKQESKQIPSYNFAKEDAIWSDDFSNFDNWTNVSDAVASNFNTYTLPPAQGGGTVGGPLEWVNATAATSGLSGVDFNTTTADNGFAWLNYYWHTSQSGIVTEAFNVSLEMTNSLDLSAYEVVTFKFEQTHIAFVDKSFIEVSLDGGTTWEQAVDVNVGTSNDNEAPILKAPVFNVNNSSTVKFRFRMNFTNVGSDVGYFWAVDDVEILTAPDYDLELVSTYTGDESGEQYSRIPLRHVQPIYIDIEAKNSGTSAISNVKFDVNETIQGDYSATSNIVASVAPEAVVALNIDIDPFVPTAVGSYKLESVLSMTEEDGNPTNQIVEPYSFQVTTNQYAHDRSPANNLTGAASFTNLIPQTAFQDPNDPNNAGDHIIMMGLDFEILEADTAFSITFQNGNHSGYPILQDDVDAEIFVTLFRHGDGELEEVGSSNTLEVQESDAGKFFTLEFTDNNGVNAQPVPLEPGYYRAAIDLTGTSKLAIATSGKGMANDNPSLQNGGVFLTPGSENWYVVSGGSPFPIIRLNTAIGDGSETPNEPGTGIAEEALAALGLNTYPNPFANETNVEFTLQDASEVSYVLVDVAGQVVAAANQGNLGAGTHTINVDGTSLANGIYFFNLNVNNTKVTQKLIVNK